MHRLDGMNHFFFLEMWLISLMSYVVFSIVFDCLMFSSATAREIGLKFKRFRCYVNQLLHLRNLGKILTHPAIADKG